MKISTDNDHTLESFPKPIRWANDMEHIYTGHQLKTLDSLLENFQNRSKIQLKLITIDSIYLSKYDFKGVLNQVAGKWHLLKQADYEDLTNRNQYFGIVILISKWDKRIKVFSSSSYYGIGEILSETDANNIVADEMFQLFEEQNYYQATLNGLSALMDKINQNLAVKEKK
ncbi:hypothetical protein GJU39_16215 [Pedobacter petrophilus]|uniref:TPM domain-containing protein n=1 Tax=Pedobacter petrophilus TaxID=1908241 RepID=A0A7K0G2N4_9SPHI|nr:hypothetical protein [Pedobacter petrophilus]